MNAPREPLGRVAAPADCEATSAEFHFWVERGQAVERTQIVSTACEVGGESVTFIGVVDEVFRRSRQRDMGEEVDRYDATAANTTPFESAGFTYAKALILRTEPVCHAAPVEESPVVLGGPAEAAIGYAFDQIRPENKLPLGRLRNGGRNFAGPAVIDLAYLLGENGGHLNVNGIAGMGAKSSFLLHVNMLLLHWARTANAGEIGRTQVVPIIFNVKGFDLFFIDRMNKNWKAEHADDWRELGVDNPQPFKNVTYFAAQKRDSETAVATGRDNVTPYSWGLTDIIEQCLFRYLFADDDLSGPNFGGLVAVLEDVLTFETANARTLAAGQPATFDELLNALKTDAIPAIGEFHAGTVSSMVRRLRGLLLDSDGVLRRDQPRGQPLVMPSGEIKGPLVIDLNGVRDDKLKRFTVAAVFQQLIAIRSRDPVEGLRYVVTLDELNRFAPKGAGDAITKMIERIAAEMRSQGIILLGAQQEASKVSPRVIENASIRVVGRSGSLEMDAEVWKFLGSSARRQAGLLQQMEKLIVQPSFRAPLLAKIPFPPWALRREEAATPPLKTTTRFAQESI